MYALIIPTLKPADWRRQIMARAPEKVQFRQHPADPYDRTVPIDVCFTRARACAAVEKRGSVAEGGRLAPWRCFEHLHVRGGRGSARTGTRQKC